MSRGPLTPDAADRVRRAAQAARELDGHDRALLDYSTMSPDHDHEVPADVRRRLADDPNAQVYAPAVVERWRAQTG